MNKYYNGMSHTNRKPNNGYRLYESEHINELGGSYPRREKSYDVKATDRLGTLAEIRRIYADALDTVDSFEAIGRALEENVKYVDPDELNFSSYFIEDIDDLKQKIFDIKQRIREMKSSNNYVMKELSTLTKVVFPYSKKNGGVLNNHYVNDVNWFEESAKARRGGRINESYAIRNKRAGDTGRYRR